MSGWLNDFITKDKGREKGGFSHLSPKLRRSHTAMEKSVLSRIHRLSREGSFKFQEGVVMDGDVECEKTGGKRADTSSLRVWPVRGGENLVVCGWRREQWLLCHGRILRTSVGQGHREAKL